MLHRRRWSDSNRRAQSCSPLPQPLRHSANERNNVAPTRERVCFSARPPGLEPGLTESESVVLPELDDRRKTNRDTRARNPTRHVDNTNNSRPTPTRQHDTRNHHTVTRVNETRRASRRDKEHKIPSGNRAPIGSTQGSHRLTHDANSADTKSRSSSLTVERRTRRYATLSLDRAKRLRNTKGGNIVYNATRRHYDMRPQGTIRCG